MENEQQLQEAAQKIAAQIKDGSEDSIPLNQPFPDELAPSSSAAPQQAPAPEQTQPAPPPPPQPQSPSPAAPLPLATRSNTNNTSPEPPASADSQPEKPQNQDQEPEKDEKNKKDEDGDSEQPQVGGYNVADLIEAPAKPPKPVQTEGAKATTNSKVMVLVGGGTLLSVLGVILLFAVSLYVGILLMVVGIIAILVGVLFPVHKI